jgi:hypothetical protein
MSILDPLKKWFPQQRNTAEPMHLFEWKTRFATLGSTGSGKTVVNGLINLSSQTLSSDDSNFKCCILEGSSRILEAVSNLRRGRFPEKTLPFQSIAAESGLLLQWDGVFGSKKIQVPICDIAGEDIQVMIQKYSKTESGPSASAYSAAMNLINYVRDSDGFILIVPASKALMFAEDKVVERESEDIAFDPDVNLNRILSDVYNHKKQSHGKPIKGIAVVITKWDLVMPYAQNMGMDIYTPSGLKEFMDVCFPGTSQILKFYGMDKIRFFPSYVDLDYNSDGSVKRWEDKTPVIKMNRRRRPSYSEQSYVDMIGYLKSFAT